MNKLQEVELAEMEYMKETDSEATKFEINDMDSLNWVFRKLAAYKSKSEETKLLAEKERLRILSWEQGELSAMKNSVEFFESMIAQYHMKQIALDPKAKTISTPYGKSKTRASKASPENVNKEELLKHILDNDMRKYVKEDVKWADFKKSLSIVEKDGVPVAIDENGQAVPGISIKPESVSYSVEV